MTLPYDIARCAGERDFDGSLCPQCLVCARQIYSGPEHCHPYYQPWMEPFRAAAANSCSHHIHINQKDPIK